jgi:hypothetical protein
MCVVPCRVEELAAAARLDSTTVGVAWGGGGTVQREGDGRAFAGGSLPRPWDAGVVRSGRQRHGRPAGRGQAAAGTDRARARCCGWA